HRQAQPGTGLPERVPGPAGQVGSAEILRVRGHVHAARAEGGDPGGLLDAGVDAPGRHQRKRQQAAVRVPLDLGLPVVVELDRQAAQRLVVDHAEVLAAQADRTREDALDVDTAVVHDREAGPRVVGALVDLLAAPVVQRDVGLLLGAVPGHHAAGTVPADRVAVEHPHPLAVDLFHPGDAVPVLGGCHAGEQVGALTPVRISIYYKSFLRHNNENTILLWLEQGWTTSRSSTRCWARRAGPG